jgi:tetratricopeptide (TPR) repeat protein
MDGQEHLFVIFGIKWTVTLVVAAIGGSLTGLLTLYKLIERWLTREERRLDILREYIDKEEKNITARRRGVLSSIRTASHSYLSDKKLDVGAEVDSAIDLLDRGYPELASGKLTELEKRLQTNEAILRKRADDLEKHIASVRIFLAAIADKCEKPELGLDYIDKAINYDRLDLDALQYKGLLLLNKGDLGGAELAYDKLRQTSTGQENASYRADAYLGLAGVNFKRGPNHFSEVARQLGNAIQNMSLVPALAQDHHTFAQIYQLQGQIFGMDEWDGTDQAKAIESYKNALNSLNQIPNKREALDLDIRKVKRELELLQPRG